MQAGKIDISFLKDLKWRGRGRRQWLKEMRTTAWAAKKWNTKYTQAEVAKKLGVKTHVFVCRLRELVKVAKSGLTLEEYAKQGRHLAAHNRIVAGGKKR